MRIVLWLGVVAMAAAGGFVAGKQRGVSGIVRGGRVMSEGEEGRSWLHPGKRPPSARSKGNGTRRSGERVTTLRAALGRLRNPAEYEVENSDPFDLSGGLNRNESRDLAMIYQAGKDDFPGILEFAFTMDERGERIWKTEVLHRMIRRWCDFDPEEALAWIREHDFDRHEDSLGLDPFGGEDLKMYLEQVVAAESLRDRPEWGLALMERIVAREKNAPPGPDEEVDPFGGGAFDSTDFGSSKFFYLAARAHPGRAVDFFMKASAELAENGFPGWSTAMIELGRRAEVESVLARFPENERSELRAGFIETLIAVAPESAREMIEGGAEGADFAMARSIRDEKGGAEALAWFMDRASAADLGERVAASVDYRFIPKFEERRAWVAQMRAEGAETGPAYELLVEQAAENHDFELAYSIVKEMPAGNRTQALAEIFEEEIEGDRLWIKGDSADLYRVSPEARGRARAAGYEEELLEGIREKNRSNWRRIERWVDELDADWEAIAPRGPLPEPEEDPFG